MKGTPFRGCGPIDAETWEGEPPEVPDFGDTFIYVRREALFPRSFEYETKFSEKFSPEDWITVDGVAVCIKVAAFAIEVTIEGEMASDRANALVRDIEGSVEADTGRACVVKCDE